MKSLGLLALVIAPFVAGCDITTSSGESPEPSSASGGNNPSSSTSLAEPSASLATSQMLASMSAQSDGTTINIYASVFDAENSYPLSLSQGDFFTATAPGSGEPVVLVLEPSNDLSVVTYVASLPALSAAEDVTIALVRRDVSVSAPSSVMHVSAPFSFVSPPTSVQDGALLNIQVSPVPTSAMTLSAVGGCLDSSTDPDTQQSVNTFPDALTFDANGNASFDTTRLSLWGGSGSCGVTFYAAAVTEGTLDPAFAGGASGNLDAEGQQQRSFLSSISQ